MAENAFRLDVEAWTLSVFGVADNEKCLLIFKLGAQRRLLRYGGKKNPCKI